MSDKTDSCRANRSTASQDESGQGMTPSGLLRSLTPQDSAINEGFFSIESTGRNLIGGFGTIRLNLPEELSSCLPTGRILCPDGLDPNLCQCPIYSEARRL